MALLCISEDRGVHPPVPEPPPLVPELSDWIGRCWNKGPHLLWP